MLRHSHLWAFFGIAVLACGGTVATGASSSGNSSGSSGTSGSSGSSGTTSSGSTTSSSGSSGGPRVPAKHRATGQNCPVDRASPDVLDPPQGSTCASHADCDKGTNGRCLSEPRTGIYRCSYDNCASDAECTVDGGGKRACSCREVGSAGTNHCQSGNCAVDADCPGGNFCSPSQGTCGTFGGTIGNYCHAPVDECTDDADCPAPALDGACRFVPEVGHFKCENSQCAG